MIEPPSLGAIQRTNGLLALAVTGVLFFARSEAAAMSCLLGAAVVMVNLYLLALLGRLLLAKAAAGSGSALGAIALPLKMLLFLGLVYLLFMHTAIDWLGFAAGVATQMAAVLVQTTWTNLAFSSRPPGPELHG